MTSPDDPEERIRQLEQSAAAYGARELGTDYTPIPKKGAPVGLIIGLLAVVIVVAFGGIAALVWRVSSTVEEVTPGGSADRPGGAPTYTPPTISFPSIPNIPGRETEQTAIPGVPVSVAGIDGTKTVVCKDGDVSISGVNNTVTLTGHCGNVNVSGVENKITVDSADVIGASGFDNEIVYLSGEPEINTTDSNTVARG